MSNFKQEDHKLLVIPGPIEVADDVLYSNARPSVSHMSPDFNQVIGDCIRMTREVVLTKDGQPFIIAGSGTLGWDQVASNLTEPNDDVLFLNTGYFGSGFVECLRIYGANVTELQADFGAAVPLPEVEKALSSKKYKIIAFTHVDTSTAVLCNVKAVTDVVKRVSPDTLVVVDGVCSVASEELHFDEWGLDAVVTASQKGLGTPPGLSIVVASQRAIKTFQERSAPQTSYYASWKKWHPIMQAYEKGNSAYFATPPVNLVYAFRTSLLRITKGTPTLEERFRLHREASKRIKDACTEMGLKQIPLDPNSSSNSMTAIYFPEGLSAADVVPRLAQRDIVVAGGVHKDYKDKYFRIGHMGITVVDKERGDLDRVINALKETITEAKASKA